MKSTTRLIQWSTKQKILTEKEQNVAWQKLTCRLWIVTKLQSFVSHKLPFTSNQHINYQEDMFRWINRLSFLDPLHCWWCECLMAERDKHARLASTHTHYFICVTWSFDNHPRLHYEQWQQVSYKRLLPATEVCIAKTVQYIQLHMIYCYSATTLVTLLHLL